MISTISSLISQLNELLKKNKNQEVILAANAALKSTELKNEEIIQLYHLLGNAYYFSNQFIPSIESFKKVLQIDPKHTESSICLSVIYNDIGKYDDAKKIYTAANQALKLKGPGKDYNLDRNFLIKHIEIGDLYFKYHRYDEAQDDYLKAFRLDPTDFTIRIKLAKVYAKKGFTTRALQELQQICSEFPEQIEPHIQLGLMYFSLGNVIDAQIAWENALKIDPKNSEITEYMTLAKSSSETRL